MKKHITILDVVMLMLKTLLLFGFWLLVTMITMLAMLLLANISLVQLSAGQWMLCMVLSVVVGTAALAMVLMGGHAMEERLKEEGQNTPE